MMPYGLTLFVLVPYFSSSSEALSLWSSWIPKEREKDSEQNVSLWKFLLQDLETVRTAWLWGHGSSCYHDIPLSCIDNMQFAYRQAKHLPLEDGVFF